MRKKLFLLSAVCLLLMSILFVYYLVKDISTISFWGNRIFNENNGNNVLEKELQNSFIKAIVESVFRNLLFMATISIFIPFVLILGKTDFKPMLDEWKNKKDEQKRKRVDEKRTKKLEKAKKTIEKLEGQDTTHKSDA